MRGSTLAEATMALLKKYRALVDQGVIAPDPAQSIAAEQLDGLARLLRKWRRRTGLSALLLGRQPTPKASTCSVLLAAARPC
jgi:predicted ATPase